jgi:hypothetical protein
VAGDVEVVSTDVVVVVEVFGVVLVVVVGSVVSDPCRGDAGVLVVVTLVEVPELPGPCCFCAGAPVVTFVDGVSGSTFPWSCPLGAACAGVANTANTNETTTADASAPPYLLR